MAAGEGHLGLTLRLLTSTLLPKRTHAELQDWNTPRIDGMELALYNTLLL